MMLALLLAVSISSPRIGTFFDLNGMVPNSVPADRTFGSDDATNSTHRLDPQEQAAVNAVFEAYCERVYYGNAGLSNVWDEAYYGPECRGGTNLKAFRFNPDDYAGRSSFHYDPDTNRVIRTRRLVEYDNIRNLCGIMTYSDGSDPSGFLYIYRPTWDRVVQGGVYEVRPRWSSTLFDGLTLEHGRPETEFPEISWCDKARFLCRGSGSKDPYYWPNLTLEWDVIGWSDEDPVNWRSSPAWSSSGACIVEDMMWRVQFGDPPHGNDMHMQGYFDFNYSLTNTTMDVVGRGYAVTNVTREARHWDAVRFTLGSDAPIVSDEAIVMDAVWIGVEEVLFWNTEPVTNRTVSGRIGVYVPTFLEGMCHYYPDIDDGPYTWVMIDFSIEFDDPDIESGTWYAEAGKEDGPPDMREYTTSYNDESVVNTPEFSFSCDVDGLGYITDFRPSIGMDDVLCTISFDYDAEVTNITRHVGLEGLTNETRRLVSDNLVGLGLGLSALDRSYCEVAHAIPGIVSNWYGYARRDYSSGDYDAPFGPLEWKDGKWVSELDEDFGVPELSATSVTNSVRDAGAAQFDDYLVYANPAGLGFGVGTYASPNGSYQSPPLFDEEEIARRIEDGGLVPDDGMYVSLSSPFFAEPNGDVVLTVYAIDISGSGTLWYDEWRFDGPSDWFSPTNTLLTTSGSATTSYYFGNTFSAGGLLDRRTGYAPYPGDYTRIDRADRPTLWTIFARGGMFGTDKDHQWTEYYGGTLRGLSYSSSSYPRLICEYASRAGGFSSLSGAWDAADGHYLYLRNSCGGMFYEHCDFDFRNPVGLLDYVSAGISESNTLSHVVLKAGSRMVADVHGYYHDGHYDSSVVSYFLVLGDGSGGVGEVHPMAVRDDHSDFELPFPVAIYQFSMSLDDETEVEDGHYPANHDFHGGAVAGRMTSLSKVNWDWKALKRERNNQ